MTFHPVIREGLVDTAKASPLVAYLSALAGGMSIAEWASLAALAYTILLIVDKLWSLVRRFRRRPEPVTLGSDNYRPPIRQPQDE